MMPRKGDLVRVTFDAVYDAYFGETCTHLIYSDRRGMEIPADAIIEPIEDLRPGDVYRTADGYLAIYSPEMNVHPDRGEPIAWYIRETHNNNLRRIVDSLVERPLTLLVRDGKPVQP